MHQDIQECFQHQISKKFLDVFNKLLQEGVQGYSKNLLEYYILRSNGTHKIFAKI